MTNFPSLVLVVFLGSLATTVLFGVGGDVLCLSGMLLLGCAWAKS